MSKYGTPFYLSLGGKQNPYAITFAGQATPWQETLEQMTRREDVAGQVRDLIVAGQANLAGLGRDLAVATGGRATLESLLAAQPDSPAASMPGILLAQYATLLDLAAEGFDARDQRPVAVAGHSQGVLGTALFEAWVQADDTKMEQIYALAELLGAAAASATREQGARPLAEQSPMLAVTGATISQVRNLLERCGLGTSVSVSLRNSADQTVLSGPPAALAKVQAEAAKVTAEDEAQVAAKVRGGRPFAPVFQFLPVGAPFHSPLLEGALRQSQAWAQRAGLDQQLVDNLAPAVLTEPVAWPSQVRNLEEAGAKWLLDVGPGTALVRLTQQVLLGTGIGVIEAGTVSGRDHFLNATHFERPIDWSQNQPQVAVLPDGTKTVQTAFTRLTGRAPVLLAGMTPTTVDPEIVAAAANAGYWAELAGGGQVTEAVFAENLSKLKTMLQPGRAAQFNAMFLDPYLWNLQFGAQSIVTKARAAGAPLDGVVVSAGIPELDEAVALLTELQSAGFPYVAFKPGTVAQIRQVVAIARATELPVIIQVEDGHAGGHHSWENLDDLLLATYADIRATPNLVLTVGGGIGTPQRAADYISGQWSLDYLRPPMPVDGVFIGTAAMTAKEAKTSPAVKQLLVETEGVASVPAEDVLGGWVSTGTTRGGVTSGQSHLRADIHEVDNAAAACARLVAEVSGREEDVRQRREEIITALAATSKPYFGDVDQMTYQQWAQRFADLCVSPVDGTWADDTWINRFQMLLQRAEGRLSNRESGEIVSIFPTIEDAKDAERALTDLVDKYPNATSTRVTPTDAAWFVDLCRKYPKPMPFVPVLDADLLRWWGQDNLWQSQDPRYTADEVRVIPGPISVAGITAIDEPIGQILARFEAAAIDRVEAAATENTDAPRVPNEERVFARLGGAPSPEAFLREVPYVSWNGNLVDNPARVVPAERLEIKANGDLWDLVISLDTAWDDIEGGEGIHAVRSLTVPVAVDLGATEGGYPVVDRETLPQHMFALLAATAGVGGETITGDQISGLPEMLPSEDSEFGEAHWTFTVNRALADLHRAATGEALPSRFDLETWTPDSLLGMCWPAIYAALGSALIEGNYPVIEGLLSAVHLDHTARLDVDIDDLLADAPTTEITVVARTTDLAESSAGRVVTVQETLFHDGKEIGFFQERFAIRGRIGSEALPVEVPAAAGLAAKVIDTPRSQLRRARVHAPANMTTFANVSGDFNPIHTSFAAARVAGLEDALVHGMWLSAVAQNLVQARQGTQLGQRITGWTYNMYGLVNLGDPVDITVERTGRLHGGGLLLEVTCKIDGQVVSRATAATAPAVTAYVYPGQGIQHQGMALDEMAASEAARDVWERADRVTRDVLGFSILTVVRDNPTTLTVKDQVLRHPEGVLNLTQFTQVALATVAFAQTARLREMGALVDHAYFAGHSLGEYNALSAYGQVFPLESVLEIVFHRGSTMHHLVPRDEQGRSNYRMAALRPNQFGVGDEEIGDYVQGVADASGEFLQIANFNLAGQQYAIAGTIAGLDALEKDATARAEAAGGKRPFMYVPGVDVPFHSSVLRDGVAEFREKLEALIPQQIPAQRLVGKYLPNLVARPFEVSRGFAEEILEEVPSEPIAALVSSDDAWEKAAANEDELARALLIELLCWQFASPVRWIETQDLMFTPVDEGGLGVERLVEIGLGNAPTLAGLAEKTLKLPQFADASASALNVQRDEQVVTCVDVRFVDEGEVDEESGVSGATASDRVSADGDAEPQTPSEEGDSAPARPSPGAPESAPTQPSSPAGTREESASSAVSGSEVTDIPFRASDAIRVVMAYQNKLRPDQIEDADTTDTLTAGVSARRNQLLVDLSAELGLPSIDGAADASVGELSESVDKLAHHYKAFGPVLTEAIRDRLRKVFGAAGVKPTFVADRVQDTWKLGAGWARAVTAQVLLGTREGDSARGGSLTTLTTVAATKAEAETIVDAAVQEVASTRGLTVAIPSTGAAAGGGVVDSAALDAYAAKVTGPNGALAEGARHLLEALGLAGPAQLPTGMGPVDEQRAADELAAQTVEAELGPRWVEMVQPRFSAQKAVLLDDRWASAREDLARAWSTAGAQRAPLATYAGTGAAVAEQARWWRAKAKKQGRRKLATYYRAAAEQAETTPSLPFGGQVAVVTGVTPDSIAGAVAAKLLQGGATVIATASKVDSARLAFAKEMYRNNAAGDASLWLVPANLASYRDVDALIDWIGTPQEKVVGTTKEIIKEALVPDLFFPFAAPPVSGSLAESGPQSEGQARLLLWSVERAISGLAALADRSADTKAVHVILPGSPNRGMFGGDGAYGEVKAAFDAITSRWQVEPSWARSTTLAHPRIGWVQGTGLMGGNDVLAPAAREAGIRTYTTEEMADELVALCTDAAREAAAQSPLDVDLTGGLAGGVDFRTLREAATQSAPGAESDDGKEENRGMIPALPSPPAPRLAQFNAADWEGVQANLEDLVVVVGIGEVGPWGSARTRWQAELGIESDGEVDLTPAGVLELAWMTGLLTWADTPESGWYDTDGNLVEPGDVYDRYRDEIIARCGVRSFITDAGIVDLGTQEDAAVFLNTDVTFTVPDQETARSYVVEDERLTRIRPLEDGEWEVTRLAGSQARLPRRATLTRTVGGQFPTGYDASKWGLSPALLEGMDRIAAWNLVSAVDAFLSAGFSPAELLQAIHPADVASTQGTGFGGMTSMRKLFVDRFLGEEYPQDVLQETLPNVVAAHTMQNFIGGYGPMVQPVSACATAAVSVEDGLDKIRAGKAKFVVAGATDDLSVESLVGFGSMNATANSAEMAEKGLSERFYSRANDRRRAGFIEAQGGGTVLLARGDLAAELGLPVQSVIAYAQSFADGIHTSIPAPGLGALASARGGKESRLAKSLETLGLSADDVTFVSKHDTSTNANDPNESDLHTRVARAIGRSEGNPMFVVSQKTLTGHAKGGACVFQISGVGQVFRDGVLPANKSLDCVDVALRPNPWLVWLRQPLILGEGEVPKAALVTSLGFGHVSSLLALVHPGAFEAALATALGEAARQAWRDRAQQRLASGAHDLEAGMLGRGELFTAAPDRRLPEEGGQVAKEAEAAMLLDPNARLGADGRYSRA